MATNPHRDDHRDCRAVSPAAGVAFATIVVVVLAIGVGILVGAVAEDIGPDATFEWSQDGDVVTLVHAGGDSAEGGSMVLEATGAGTLNGSTGLGSWGIAGNGSELHVGVVEEAILDDGEIVGTVDDEADEEFRGIGVDVADVIAVAYDGTDFQNGTVLLYEPDRDLSMDDLRSFRLTYQGSLGLSTELAEYRIERD